MTLEDARMLELHNSVSVASGISHHELIQTAVSYSNEFLKKENHIQVWQWQYLSEIYEWMPNDAVQSSMSEQYSDICTHSKMTV